MGLMVTTRRVVTLLAPEPVCLRNKTRLSCLPPCLPLSFPSSLTLLPPVPLHSLILPPTPLPSLSPSLCFLLLFTFSCSSCISSSFYLPLLPLSPLHSLPPSASSYCSSLPLPHSVFLHSSSVTHSSSSSCYIFSSSFLPRSYSSPIIFLKPYPVIPSLSFFSLFLLPIPSSSFIFFLLLLTRHILHISTLL